MRIIESADLYDVPDSTQNIISTVTYYHTSLFNQEKHRRLLFSIFGSVIRYFNHVLKLDVITLRTSHFCTL